MQCDNTNNNSSNNNSSNNIDNNDGDCSFSKSKEIIKAELIILIRDWIALDTELPSLQKKVREKTTQKKKITEKLTQIMKRNEIDNFKTKNGLLVHKQKKQKKGITKKYLINQLNIFYKDNLQIASDVTQHLLSNREEVIKDEIRRIIN